MEKLRLTNGNVETIKADAKKAVSDLENIMFHAKAGVVADVEKVKADLDNKLVHEKADAAKVKIS